MAIPAEPTVAITLGPAPQSPAPPTRSISGEYGGSSPFSINQYYRGGPLVPANTHPAHGPLTNFGTKNIPTSGQIDLAQFNGTSKRISVTYQIQSNTASLNLFTFASSTARPLGTRYYTNLPGWDITFQIRGPTPSQPQAVVVSAPRTGTALTVGTTSQWNPDVTLTLINQGVISGGSGGGRAGGFGFGNSPAPARNGQPGLSGGTAINAQRPITIVNNGAVRGGAGGGGGGGGAGSSPGVLFIPPKFGGPIPFAGDRLGGGGGGGGRRNNPIAAPGGAGGGVPFPTAGQPGQAGSIPNHGNGGAGFTKTAPPGFGLATNSRGGNGGRGGQRAANGVAGQPGFVAPGSGGPPTASGTGGAGGARGNYAVGFDNITWPVTGTRQGSTSP